MSEIMRQLMEPNRIIDDDEKHDKIEENTRPNREEMKKKDRETDRTPSKLRRSDRTYIDKHQPQGSNKQGPDKDKHEVGENRKLIIEGALQPGPRSQCSYTIFCQ